MTEWIEGSCGVVWRKWESEVVTAFLKAVYLDLSCEVKEGEECSEPFGVSCGLRQGCILSPLLFSLYVNSLVYKLKEAEVGV